CARAAEPRGRSPLRSGRHLSQSAVVAAAGGRRAGGAERRVGRRAPLLQSGVHAQTIGADSGGGGASAARAADRIITVEPHAGFYTTSRDVTRILRSWARRKLGREAHIDEGTLCDSFAGRRSPTFGTLRAIVRRLSCRSRRLPRSTRR